MNILIPNLGSTSLKYQVIDMPSERVLGKGRLERVSDYRDAIRQVQTGETIDAVALKAVHAGPAFREAMPGVPVVAAFEPESHEYIAGRVAELMGRAPKLVSCHLGGSSSMCAIEGGCSVD